MRTGQRGMEQGIALPPGLEIRQHASHDLPQRQALAVCLLPVFQFQGEEGTRHGLDWDTQKRPWEMSESNHSLYNHRNQGIEKVST